MSYHKFSNLREIFQGDLNRKLMDGIISWDFMDQPCNCNSASKIDGKCAYNGECRKMCVVYKATCRVCDESYPATATVHQRLMGNVPIMESVGKCV
jgi:hypothetical protein